MTTILTHAVAGSALASTAPFSRRRGAFWAIVSGLAMLPDADVVAFSLRVPYGSMWAHRGITHSLFAAVVVGTGVALAASRALGMPRGRLAACFVVAMASHGVLDAFTNGGLGIAFLAPFSAERYRAPWTPIEVSPLGLGIASERGVEVLRSEAAWVWAPSAALAGLSAAIRAFRRRAT